MKIAVFGPGLLSSYRNEGAAYFRGLLRALHGHGHAIAYLEPDDAERAPRRDLAPPPWAAVTLYAPTVEAALRQAEAARAADWIIKTTGAGPFDTLLAEALLDLRQPGRLVTLWDAGADATPLAESLGGESPLHRLLPRYDCVWTAGGAASAAAYRAAGARQTATIPPALDPQAHFPVPPEERWRCTLAFLGDRRAGREGRVREFLHGAAARLGGGKFLLAGEGWAGEPALKNLHQTGHLEPGERNALHASALAVLEAGECPAGTPSGGFFAAAGAGACVLSGSLLAPFFEPEREYLPARDGAQAAALLAALDPERAAIIGRAALRCALAEHTYAHRARAVEAVLGNRLPRPVVAKATYFSIIANRPAVV